MKMKKLLALLLVLMLALSLAACGEKEPAADPVDPVPPVQDEPKSEYQLAYDKALTAFYLPEGIWQLQLLDDSGKPNADTTVYLRFNNAEGEFACTTTLQPSDGLFGGAVSHSTTATNTTTTTMRITDADGAFVELALDSIDVGSRARYNVVFAVSWAGENDVPAAALLQPLTDDDTITAAEAVFTALSTPPPTTQVQ